jgi:hypothetical protein
VRSSFVGSGDPGCRWLRFGWVTFGWVAFGWVALGVVVWRTVRCAIAKRGKPVSGLVGSCRVAYGQVQLGAVGSC